MWSISGDTKPLKDPVLNGPMDIHSDKWVKGEDIEHLHHIGHAVVVAGHLVWMIGKNVALSMIGL